MSKYSGLLYSQSYYGQKSRLAFSVEPFTAVAVDYSAVQLAWSSPVGGYLAFRIVRNQEGYSETVEDGVVIYEEFGIDGTSGTVSISEFSDGIDNPADPALVGGKFSYYRVWVLKESDKVWYPAGESVVLVPSSHPTYGPYTSSGNSKEVLLTTHDKVMNLLPRVFTSTSQSPIDEVSADTDLYRFMQGFSFTIDEFLSMADSLLPEYTERKTNPRIIGVKADQLGLTREPNVSIKNQKRMLSQALYLYGNKGTFAGVSSLVESLTGYAPDVTVSPNLMLSNADSTFNGGIGFWLPIGNCTIAVEDVNPVTSESNTVDRMYSAKVVVGTAGAKASNGADYPVTRGIPVSAEVEYTYSFYAQTATGTKNVTPTIYWYDYTGALLSSSAGSAHSSTTTWSKGSVTATAPTDAAYASIELLFGSTGTYYIDMVQFATSDIVTYNEARAAYIFLYPKKNNFVLNPSFENGYSTWDVTSGTPNVITADVPQYDLTGTHVLELTPDAGDILLTASTGGDIPIGGYLTFSIFGKSMANSETISLAVILTSTSPISSIAIADNVATIGINDAEEFLIGDEVVLTVNELVGGVSLTNVTSTIVGFDGTNPKISLSLPDLAQTAVTGTLKKSISKEATGLQINSSWTRVQMNTYVPDKWVSARTSAEVQVYATGLTDVVYFDAAQLEPSYLATDYFDGDYGTERDALWADTPNASNSYLYPNKITNVSRLSAEIGNFLPQDTPYIISSYSGIEASGFTD